MFSSSVGPRLFLAVGILQSIVFQSAYSEDAKTIPMEFPSGRVTFSLTEKLPKYDQWMQDRSTLPKSKFHWTSSEYLLPRIPFRYDDWGIRDAWKSQVLLVMESEVDLPVGRQKFLLRARGLSRLLIDGQVVASTKADKVRYRGGRNPIHPPPKAPLPGVRPRRGNMQEVLTTYEIKSNDDDKTAQSMRRCRVVLEVIVGGRGIRTESGEICVGIQTADGKMFDVLRPVGHDRLPLTEEAVQPALVRIERELTALDAKNRQQAASSEDPYWSKRHVQAQKWVQDNPPPVVPKITGQADIHPIDAFILRKIQTAQASKSAINPNQTKSLDHNVVPILRQHCFRCHGEKDKGGLRLNTRQGILGEGDSGLPAVKPGHPSESELLARIESHDESLQMPPSGKRLSAKQIGLIKDWIRAGAPWPRPVAEPASVAIPPSVGDEAFLRRVYIDTIGLPPTRDELARFLQDNNPNKREVWINKLLADKRVADNWISLWQDLLAENPTLISATLNSTGPFRWFLYESLRDQKPVDRLATELIMMRGSPHEGGSAGFALAGGNDSPFAAKAHIVASAFLGIELKCARCHDAPFHRSTQNDLYSLAAMLNRKSLRVPKSSQVPPEFFEKQTRQSMIQVSINPKQAVKPSWPFAHETGVTDDASIDSLVHDRDDSRERLAALITSPKNRRFSRVMVNHIWKRLMGAGLVEPIHDWEGQKASHPELLDWLAAQLVSHQYDARHVMRLIMTSAAYQRQPVGRNADAPPETRFFNAPDRRRLSAEQVVDALHVATGTPFITEPLSFDPEGRSLMNDRLYLGQPTRAWMLADLKNERDRPSLSLPRNRMMVDLLEVFGWTGARQEPIVQREIDPNVLQPGILANSVLTVNVTRASANSMLANLAIRSTSPDQLIEALFAQILNRPPRADEKAACVDFIALDFNQRQVPANQVKPITPLPRLPKVTWFNHAQSESNNIQMEHERRLRQGPSGDPRLQPQWRERFEDVVWSLVNHPEFVWIP